MTPSAIHIHRSTLTKGHWYPCRRRMTTLPLLFADCKVVVNGALPGFVVPATAQGEVRFQPRL